MRAPAFFILLVVSVLVNAQYKHEPQQVQGSFSHTINNLQSKQVFCHIKLYTSEADPLQSVLLPALNAVGYGTLDRAHFEVEYRRESGSGTFIQFRFAPGGVRSFSHFIKVFYDKNKTLREISFILGGCEKWALTAFPDEAGIRTALGTLQVLSLEKRWFYDGQSWQGAWLADVKKDIAATGEKRLYGKAQELLFSEPSSQLYTAFKTDTLVSVKVFNPDPLTSAEMPYGGLYQDFNDADSPAINNERIWARLKTELRNDTFFLADTNFRFEEIEGPITPIPFSMDTVFNYNRSDDNFEYVNAMFHLQAMRDRVHSFGFNLPGFVIQVDPHAANGADFSAFSPSYSPPALFFGDGGIDDAEDADVIVHEFGHAMMHGAAPFSFDGAERKAGDEGTCDYFAMGYSRRINEYGWQKTFSWDGNLTWQGRVINSPKVYPADNRPNDIYYTSEIWSSCLAEIYDSLGADITDSLVFAGLYHLAPNMSLSERALAIMLEDTLMNNARNIRVLHYFFFKRGLLGPLGITTAAPKDWRVNNSYGFSNGEYVEVTFGGTPQNMTVQLIDVQGRILQEEYIQDQYSYRLSSLGIEKGVYFLRLQSSTHPVVNIKLVRY